MIKETGACRGFSNRCGAKNSAREEFLSATPIFFWLLGYFGYFFAVLWLFFVALRILGVALIVGETPPLISPLCTRLLGVSIGIAPVKKKDSTATQR